MQTTLEDRSRQAVEISNQLDPQPPRTLRTRRRQRQDRDPKGFVITFLEDIYTPFEKTLISGGHEQLVIDAASPSNR